MEHGVRPLKLWKCTQMPSKPCRAALRGRGGSASAPQVYVVMLSSHLFMLRVQFCNTALTHRGVLGANRKNRCVGRSEGSESGNVREQHQAAVPPDWQALWPNFLARWLTVRRPTIHRTQPQSSDQMLRVSHADHEARMAELQSRTSARSSSPAWFLSPSCSSSPGSCHQRAPEPTTRPMKRQHKSDDSPAEERLLYSKFSG